MRRIQYIDNNYYPELSDQSILSIRYATDGFSYCIHDANDQLVAMQYIHHFSDTPDSLLGAIREFFTTENWLSLKYRKVYICGCDRKKFLIPEKFFQEKSLPFLGNIVLESDSIAVVYTPHIVSEDTRLVSCIDEQLFRFFQDHFPECIIINNSFPFIYSALKTEQQDNIFFADIQKSYIDLLILSEKNIRFFNAFQYQTETDIVYFLLNTLKTLSIHTDKIAVHLSGTYERSFRITELLSRYIKVSPAKGHNNLPADFRETFNESAFTNLLNLHRCGL